MPNSNSYSDNSWQIISIRPNRKKRVPHRPTKVIESKKIKAKKRSKRKAALRKELKET